MVKVVGYVFLDAIETSDEGYIVAGSTYVNSGRSDAIIIKYNEKGNIEWQQNYSGSASEDFEAITTSPDGGYVVVGESISTDIEGIDNNGGLDAIIVKYDENGNIEWQKNYGGSGSEKFNEITTSPDGGYVVVGYSTSSDIEGIDNKGSYDGIIIKYDGNGNIEWQQNYGGSDVEMFNAITTSPYGGYTVVGYENSTKTEETANKVYNAIIVKYDEEGNIERQESYAYADNTTFVDIIYDGKDFVVSRT